MRRQSLKLKKSWVVVVLLLVASWYLDAPEAAVLQVDAAQTAPNCEEWNTREFFETATVEDVTACLDAGADPIARDGRWRETALHMAAWASTEPLVIEILLEAGADVDAQDELGKTPLQGALLPSSSGEPAVIEALVLGGADPNVRDSNDWTPLHSAAFKAEDAPVIRALLAAGAPPSVPIMVRHCLSSNLE